MEIKICPLCGNECKAWDNGQLQHCSSYLYECSTCGVFEISNSDISRIQEKENEHLVDHGSSMLYKISSFIIGKNLHNKINPVILHERNNYTKDIKYTFTVDEILASFPESLNDKLDRILLNLFKKHPKPGIPFNEELIPATFNPLFYSEEKYDASFYLKALAANHYVTMGGPDRNLQLSITPEGFNKIYELQTDNPEHSKNVFVALSFDHKQSYHDAIKPILLDFGFDPICMLDIDGESDNIDNKIMAGIRKSHFMVADLTLQNNGAYWEAGMAYGLGRPVILCCENKDGADPSKIVHFDLNHNTILFYKDFEDLKKKLIDWIEANGRIVIPKKRL